ncbi:hypothetical protein HN51_048091 [Arachis hypogaea]
MRSNLDALNVNLQDFFVHLYSLILEYRPGSFYLFDLKISAVFSLPRVKELLDWLELPVSVIIGCVELRWPVAIAKQRNISAVQ